MPAALFDTWTEKYDQWFATPTGRLVRAYESALLLELLTPCPSEHILDVGCGTGIFTEDVLAAGVQVTGIDLSIPMLQRAVVRLGKTGFSGVAADMRALPFADHSFDRVFSMTAIHFQPDDPVDRIPAIERSGQERQLENGALLAVQWRKS